MSHCDDYYHHGLSRVLPSAARLPFLRRVPALPTLASMGERPALLRLPSAAALDQASVLDEASVPDPATENPGDSMRDGYFRPLCKGPESWYGVERYEGIQVELTKAAFEQRPCRTRKPKKSYVDKCYREWKHYSLEERAGLIVRLFHQWPNTLYAFRKRMLRDDKSLQEEEHRERNRKRHRKNRQTRARRPAASSRGDAGSAAGGDAAPESWSMERFD